MSLPEDVSTLLESLDDWAVSHVPQQQQQQQDGSSNEENNTITAATPRDLTERFDKTTTISHKDDNNNNTRTILDPKLHDRVRQADALVSVIDAALDDLNSLEQQHRLVSDKTQSLHEICKRLLQEQARLDRVVAGIKLPMSYFMSLDEIGPKLGLPLSSGLQPNPTSTNKIMHPDDAEFRAALTRLDECAAYVSSHPNFYEYDAYSAKFRQLQIRALTMIKKWVVTEIEKIADSVFIVVAKKKTTSLTSLLDDAHLYRRFVEKGKLLRSSIEELEKRQAGLDNLMECVNCLCRVRLRLLSELVTNSEEVSTKNQQGLVSGVFKGGEFLTRVFAAEQGVFTSFFSSAARHALLLRRQLHNGHGDGDDLLDGESASRIVSPPKQQQQQQQTTRSGTSLTVNIATTTTNDPFSNLLEHFGNVLYDTLRPMIVRATDLEQLCDAVAAVESVSTDAKTRLDRDALQPFERVFSRITFDIQERLVFCGMKVVQNDIAGFVPTTQDLDYPGKLSSKSSMPENESWYPPLERTLSVLSKIYRAVDQIVFQQLAQEAVASCTQALVMASKRIAAKSGLDHGDLFLVRHLLVLREQISPFRTALSFREPRLDFASTSAALSMLFSSAAAAGTATTTTPSATRSRREALLNLIRQVSVPVVRDSEVDTKRELDTELKRASENYILRVSKRCLGPLYDFVDQTQMYLQKDDATWEGLSKQNFCDKTQVLNALTYCESSTTGTSVMMTAARSTTLLYLTHPQTRQVLLNAVETNLFKVVNSAVNLCRDLYKDDDVLNERLSMVLRMVGEVPAPAPPAPAPTESSVSSDT